MKYTSPHLPPTSTLLYGGAVVVALLLMTAFFDGKINEIVSMQDTIVQQSALISKSSTKNKCPAPEVLELCVVRSYFRDKKMTEEEISTAFETRYSFTRTAESFDAKQCPSSKEKIASCLLDQRFQMYDKYYAYMAGPSEITGKTILAELGKARAKGVDAAIKSNLNNARAQAEIYYDNNSNSYSSVCAASTGIDKMITAADAANGTGAVLCSATASSWVAAAALQSDANSYYCVDSTGETKVIEGKIPARLTRCSM
jgi:hypothetical protein